MSTQQELVYVLPLLVLGFGALLIPMLEVFLEGVWSRAAVAAATLLATMVALFYAGQDAAPGLTIFKGTMYADPLSYFVGFVIVFGAVMALLLSFDRVGEEGIESPSEYYALFLMSTIGALIFCSAAELITLFLGLEIMSMALYCMCGSALTVRGSSESALKYFLLGSFSSAFLLYGIALLYGLTGSTRIEVVAQAIASIDNPVLYFSMGLILVGMIFKIGGVPFHFWTPDVYQGAPTSVTAFMACVIKASAVAAALRLFWSGLGELFEVWSGAVWLVAVLTMTVGNLVALRQRSMKRMLAYSSIAHAGYMLVAFLAPSTSASNGGAAVLFYLIAYTLMTLGSFGVVLAVSKGPSPARSSDDISKFNGLGSKQPQLAFLMSLFMLSLAGIPPGLAGLLGKFYIFNAAVNNDFIGLAIIGVMNSAVSCYYYLRVIVAMYFVEADDNEPLPELNFPLQSALTICAVGVIVLGLMPWSVHDGAVAVMALLRR